MTNVRHTLGEHERKLPRRQRQLLWLERATYISTVAGEERGIVLQVEGGVAYDKDLRDLVLRGLLEMTRQEYRRAFGGYPLSRSVLRITPKGREALAEGRIV